MVLTFKAVSEELLAPLRELEDRRGPDGQPWCPPADARAVRRLVIDRSARLGTAIDHAVRLARVAALASPRAYHELLYTELKLLRASGFRAVLRRAAATGRLAPDVVAVEEAGVLLREPGMQTGVRGERPRDGFELTFAQMPRLAAMLDLLHNTLGYSAIADLLAPVTTRRPAATAAEVAREVRNSFNAWLAPRLESAHRRQQAKVLAAFLVDNGIEEASEIDNEAVLRFWERRAVHWHEQRSRASHGNAADLERIDNAARDEGFRRFRSAVRSVLRYRSALADAQTELALGYARDIDGEPDVADGHDVWQETWVSPLQRLCTAEARAVKWLTAKEERHLANLLGSVSAAEPDDASQSGETEATEAGNGALASDGPLDAALALTLLRVDCLEPLQARLIARQRQRTSIAQTLSEMAGEVESASYAALAETYRETAAQLALELDAALDILARAGEPTALLVIGQLAGEEPRRRLVASLARAAANVVTLPARGKSQTLRPPAEMEDESEGRPVSLAAFGPVLAALWPTARDIDPALGALVDRCAAARRKVNRQGFTRADAADPAMRQALALGLDAAIALEKELRRFDDHLDVAAWDQHIEADRGRFLHALTLVHGD